MYVWLYGQIYIYRILRKPTIERTLGGPERYQKKEYIRVNPIRPRDFWYLKDPGGGQICPHPIYMGLVGGRFQN